MYCYLSHALKNCSQSEAWKAVAYLRYPTGSIQRVVVHPAFPPLLASDYRNGAKTVCVRFRNGAKVVGQRRESALHKVKIISLMIKAHILAKVRNILNFSTKITFLFPN